MSADNYLYVSKCEDGKYGVFDRCASCYYADEGHTVESLQADFDAAAEFGGHPYVVDESWIVRDRKPWRTFDTADEAIKFAHLEEAKSYYEYGGQLADEVLREWVP